MHSLSKIPRKFSVIKNRFIFQTIIFFPQVVFSGAGVWSWEDINRPSRGHMPVESPSILRASPDNTVRPDQSNCLSLNISSACLFYLFNKQNKLNLLVCFIFLATTHLYITLIILMISSCLTFGGFLSKFSKCCFHRCIHSCWLVAFSLAFTMLLLLLTLFTVCHAILEYLSSTESLILSIWFCMYSVCSFR